MSIYNIINIEFPEQKVVYSDYCELFSSLGLLLGPIIGSTIYNWLEYKGTFYIIAGLQLLTTIILIIILPPPPQLEGSLDSYNQIRSSNRTTNRHSQIVIIGYLDFLKNKRVMVAIITSIFAMTFLLFFHSTLSVALF